MQARATRHSRIRKLLFALSACALLLCAVPAEAQIGGGGMGRGGRRGGRHKPTKPPPAPPKEIPGSVRGTILSYKPPSERALARDEDLVGILKIRPLDKDLKILTLKVRRPEDEEEAGEGLDIRVGRHRFTDPDEFPDLFLKGLYVTAGWVYEDPDSKRKSKPKLLRSIAFDSMRVEGEISEIEDDQVILKGARPKDGKPWPKRPGRTDRAGDGKKKEKKIRARKLRLRALEDVSKFLDADKEESDLGDFEVGQTVEVRLVFSTKVGMLLEMSIPSEEESEPGQADRPPGEDRGGRRGHRPPGRRG